ncbi:MAG: gliding motility-associated C-terminal domain-containing protein [Saprospiraceae bacterium]|nr:gliding motility-associated C-terminal domain-containing protein [Saprospiraceae bacterium]
MAFANSPCTTAQKLSGRIDEISLYARALSEIEIKEIYIFPDQIVTDNTTIFKGQSITLETGPSCATNIQWIPPGNLDDPTSPNPVASPDISTTFNITFDHGTCVSKDSVRIFVAEKDKLDCNNLLLPKAFTPNNDGLNDRFGISNTFLLDDLEYFEIYNRWGAKVWETNDLLDSWDGNINNAPGNGGMYIFRIKYVCNGEEKLYINNFSLIR